MKKLFFYSAIVITVFMFSSFVKYLSVKASVLEMSGYVLKDEKKVEGSLVKLYQNNSIVNKMLTKSNARFKFLLFSDNEYMIEVSKEGTMDERVYINTKTSADLDDKYYFEFIVDLMDADKYKNIDASNLDFPTAIIKYDAGEDEYVHDKGYTQQVRNDLKKMNEQLNKKK
ncbi:MAG: hypothetical protein HYU68_00030 [Bacteroidetes bacterium]|nr:hypothetical protein [Bacteroidota bacterium]